MITQQTSHCFSILYIRFIRILTITITLVFSCITFAKGNNIQEKYIFETPNHQYTQHEFNKLHKVLKFTLVNFPKKTCMQIFEDLLDESSFEYTKSNIKTLAFTKKYLLRNALLKELVTQNPEILPHIQEQAEQAFEFYCIQNKIDIKNLLTKAEKINIKKDDLVGIFFNKGIENSIISSSMPSFMSYNNNYLEKLLIAQPNCKLSDVRVVYEEFTAEKSNPKSYQALLTLRSNLDCAINQQIKNSNIVKYKKHTCYYKKHQKHWSPAFCSLLYSLSTKKSSSIFLDNDKLTFIRLINYEILGNQKDDIENLANMLEENSMRRYKDKFYYDAVNYVYINYSDSKK